MRLLNPLGRLPGGWRYEQFDANGKLLHKWSNDFGPFTMFLGKVRDFRVANQLAGATAELVEKDVTEYLARDFDGDPKYFTLDPGQKKTSLTSRFQSRFKSLAGVVDTARKIFTGEEILREWLGDGLKPVGRETAQYRAGVCLGANGENPCPHNQPGSVLIEEAARWVQAMSEKKNDMKLTVVGEERLESCKVCICDLKLKVHVPIETIFSKTPKAMLDKFASEAPVNCWMRNRR